ncbi:MAG: 4Fe-4S binding protein [Deltaproteobacteria bacterium]|nr:4Fe-4S binding protein [Deltaproteobacteria bacterium]
MLNLECKKEIKERKVREEEVRLDFARHDPPFSENEAEVESSRCLGTGTCEACDLCRLLCPDLAITRDPETGAILIDLDYCKGCGICAAICPKGAITMELEA